LQIPNEKENPFADNEIPVPKIKNPDSSPGFSILHSSLLSKGTAYLLKLVVEVA
jgi:hypothetical protein